MMNHDNQDPLDKKLSRLYQQRKQQLNVPDSIAAQKHAQQKPRRSSWLFRPLWASSITACFVIVVSYYFMPQDFSVDEATIAHMPISEQQDSPQAFTEAAPMADTAESMLANAGASNARVLSKRSNSVRSSRVAPKAEMAEMEMTEVADTYQAKPQAGQQARGITRNYAAPIAKPISKPISTLIVARLLPTAERPSDQLPSQRYAKDCQDQMVAIDQRWLDNITPGDWVQIEFGPEHTITSLKKLTDYPGCKNDR